VETLGKKVGSIIGSKCYREFWQREGPCPHCMMDATFKSGQPQRATVRVDDQGGTPVTIEINTYPLTNEAGDVVRGIEILHDVSEREQMMHELVQTRALALLGKYCAELTHEIKNPLNSIAIQIHLMQRFAEQARGKLKEDMQDTVRVLREEVERLNNLSREYLQITKAPPLEMRIGSIPELLNETIELVRPMLSLSKVVLKTEIQNNLQEILVDRDRMKQVFLNIINNAVDAMPGGGTLTITAAAGPSSVSVSFADTGSGIPPETSSKVFEPFFSTKQSGTGLGLTLAKNIVEAHGGAVCFKNRGTGAMFTVEIPIRVS
jgi:signal transduction histidine kinase